MQQGIGEAPLNALDVTLVKPWHTEAHQIANERSGRTWVLKMQGMPSGRYIVRAIGIAFRSAFAVWLITSSEKLD